MGQRTNEKTASTRTDDMEQRMTRGIVWRSTIIFTLGENHFPVQAKYVESLIYLGSHFKIKAQCPPMPHNIHTFALNLCSSIWTSGMTSSLLLRLLPTNDLSYSLK